MKEHKADSEQRKQTLLGIIDQYLGPAAGKKHKYNVQEVEE